MNQLFKIAVFISICISISHTFANESNRKEVVRFAPEKDYGPFVYEDKDGNVKGLSVDILNAINMVAGLNIQTLPAKNLSDILAGVQRGEVDLVSSLRPTPERAQYLNFSRPYVSVPAVLVRNVGLPTRTDLSTLSGRRVAVGKGYAVENFVREKYPDVEWMAVPDDAAALRALFEKKVEGVVADIASVKFVIEQQKMTGLEIHNPVGFEYQLSFAYSKNRPDIGEAIEHGMRAFNTGDRTTYTQKWLHADNLDHKDSRVDSFRWVALVATLIAAILMAIALLKRFSKKATHDGR